MSPLKRYLLAAGGCVALATVASPGSGDVVYRTLDHAHNNHRLHAGNISSLLQELNGLRGEMIALVQAETMLLRRIAELETERDDALRELRLGRYCSNCKRVASQIEREEKISFSQHLVDVQGQPLPAPPELIRAKEEEYEEKLRAPKQALEDGRTRIGRIKSRRVDLMDKILNQQRPSWVGAITAEGRLLAERQSAERQRRSTAVSRLQRRVTTAERTYLDAIRSGSPALDALKAVRDALRVELDNANRALLEARAAHSQETVRFFGEIQAEKRGLMDLAGEGPEDQFVLGSVTPGDLDASFTFSALSTASVAVPRNIPSTPATPSRPKGDTSLGSVKLLLEGRSPRSR